jgi:nitrogen fixation NifU-like protein
MYSEQVLEHFQNPRNVGELADADAAVELENPACGDILLLAARVDKGRLSEVRFRARGCVAAIACGSAMTELLHRRTMKEAAQITRQQLLASVGSLPNESMHASHLAMDAATALLKKLSSR